MDIDVNKILLVGTVNDVGELRTFPSGSTLCTLTLVTTERFTRRDGEMGERKNNHQVNLWGELAKRVNAEFSRGMRVAVEGRINRRSYERDGETRWFTDLVASSCIALDDAQGSYERRPARPQPPPPTPAPPPAAKPPPPLPGNDDDDLPF